MSRAGVSAALVALLLLLVGCTAKTDGTGSPARAAGAGIRLTPLTGNDVLFFGDSWTSGFGSDAPKTDGFVPLTAKKFGWRYDAVSVAGGGYVKTGGQDQTFVERLRAVSDTLTTPDLVVLQGGLNDKAAPPQQVATAFMQVVQVMRNDWPKAQIVVLGPMAATAAALKGVTAVDAALSRAAASVSVPYVDAQQEDWLGAGAADPQYINSSKANHPSSAGYAQIATRLEAALTDLGL